MSEVPSDARTAFGDLAPLVTVAAFSALDRSNELPFHVKRALENGATRDEIVEVLTHLAFYSGWPTANTALFVVRRVFEENGN